MKTRSFVSVIALLFVLVSVPTVLFADSSCQTDHTVYQYQPCGTVAVANLYEANSSGIENGLIGDFQGYNANFADSVYAVVWRNNSIVYTGPSSPSNQQLSQYEQFTLVPAGVLQAGDMIELVASVQDINGAQNYYSQRLDQNLDGLNHFWATSMMQDQCDPNLGGSCVFVGLEDLPMQEGSDFDYNDFKMWVYGMDATPMPEPSSIILLTGAPLAFALGKLKRFF